MTATPKFLCVKDNLDKYYSCTRDQICNENHLFYKIDNLDPAYIGGYFDQMKMTCWTNFEINLIA